MANTSTEEVIKMYANLHLLQANALEEEKAKEVVEDLFISFILGCGGVTNPYHETIETFLNLIADPEPAINFEL